jgi:hypothetical protein
MIDKWLKAEVLEAGALRRTTSGTPQGGVISPRRFDRGRCDAEICQSQASARTTLSRCISSTRLRDIGRLGKGVVKATSAFQAKYGTASAIAYVRAV